MVVTDFPATCDTWVWHEKARLPSTCTMQAPHRPVPHPNLVPVSLSSSRITHNSGVCGGALECAALPLTLKSNAIGSSLTRCRFAYEECRILVTSRGHVERQTQVDGTVAAARPLS